MAGFAPKLSSGVTVRQPVSPVAPAGITLAESLFDVLGSTGQATQPQPKESELKADALRPFTQRLEDLRNSDLSDAQFTRASRKALRDFIQTSPQYAPQARDIASDVYGVTEPVLEAGIVDTVTTSRNAWMATPEGQLALQSAVVYHKDGRINEEATTATVFELHAQSQAEQATLERSNRQLKTAQNDLEERRIDREEYLIRQTEAMEEFVQPWTNKVVKLRDGIIQGAANGLVELDTPEEQMAALREMRMTQSELFVAKAQAAGITPEVYQPKLIAIMKPLDDMINLAVASGGDTERLLKQYNDIQELSVRRKYTEVLGPLAGDPFIREYVIPNLFKTDLENIAEKLDAVDEWSKQGKPQGIQLFRGIPTSSAEAASTTEQVTEPSRVEDAKRKMEEDDKYFKNQVKGNVGLLNTLDTSKKGWEDAAFNSVAQISVLADASSEPFGPNALKGVFNPTSSRVLAEAVKGTSQASVDIKNSLVYFSANQIRKNTTIANEALSSLNGEARMEKLQDGRTVITLNGNRVQTANATGNLKLALEAVDRINLVNDNMKRILPDFKKPDEELDGQSLQDYLNNIPVNEQFANPERSVFEVPEAVRADTGFVNAVHNLEAELNAPQGSMMRIIAFETAGTFDPSITNSIGATGLIQFLKGTAKEFGTTTDKLAKMDRTEQMYFVGEYMKKKLKGVDNPTFSDMYMAVLWPAAVGEPDSYVLFKEGTEAYTKNAGLDTDNSGTVTKGEAAARAFGSTGTMNVAPTSSTTPVDTTASRESAVSPDVEAFVQDRRPPVQSELRGSVGVGTGEVSPATPEASQTPSEATSSQAATAQLDRATRQQLIQARIDPDEVPRFNTVEEVDTAVESGEVVVGSIVIVEGKAYIVEGEEDGGS